MQHDVIVIGGGPSGSTAANLLAQAGFKVLLLEKETFPRFHIGESLLPCDLEIFERLGFDHASKNFLYKAGAEFLDERIGGHDTYLFREALPNTPSHAYQVDRATFDHELLKLAEDKGVEVHQSERVLKVEKQQTDGLQTNERSEHILVETDKAHYSARYLIDATGQEAFFGRRDRTNTQLTDFGLAATFAHFEDLSSEVDHELCVTAEGNIKILFVDEGWVWAIPLGGRRISIGLVTRKKGITSQWLDDTIAASTFLTRITKGARRARKPGLISSFSFHNKIQHGERFACTGDAACFLDPVFSSGVSLGMVGAAHLVDTLLPALREHREDQPSLMDPHAEHMAQAYKVFATLIKSFYQSPLLHDLFFAKDKDMQLKLGLTSVLAGDVWRNDNPFQNMLLKSERRVVELLPHVYSDAL